MTDGGEDFAWHGWVDESIHVEHELYIMAVVVCDPSDCDQIRDTLRSLREENQSRLHWGQESPKRREKLAASISDVDMSAIVVVGAPLAKRKQERARRICMETLLPTVCAMGVGLVTFEARAQSLNDHDMTHIESIRGKRLIPASLRIEIGQPADEPMLWIPDIVAGAVGAARRGNKVYVEMLGRTVTEIDVVLR